MEAADELDGYASLHSLMEINEKSNMQPLPEDTAWADSLLIEDPETSGISWNDWTSFTDALSGTLSAEHASLSAMQDDSPTVDVDDIQIPRHRKSPASPESLSTGLDDVLAFGEADGDSKKLLRNEDTDILWSKEKLESALRPTYSEDLRPSGASLKEDDLFPSSLVIDQPIEGIFQVWDLDFPAEEDEWIEQLNKALDGSSSEPFALPSASASTVSIDFADIKMEDLISGMEELSLNRFL